jgi:NADPH:quinone reductase-like Zn-dependent oxidoreductase
MKTAWRERYGPPETVVEIRDVPMPVPTGDEVLVRVRAASVNRTDLDGMYPKYPILRLYYGVRRPRRKTLGLDVAGVVEGVGPEVRGLKVGDDVFADLYAFGQDAFSEYVCAPERAFAAMPPTLTYEGAATLPHAALLAVQALRSGDDWAVGPGDRVLIVGASGNVGPFAVQIAKWRGAEVTGVASGPKLDFVRSLGADKVIDYRLVDVTRTGDVYDWIVDVDTHQSMLSFRRVLKRGGTYRALGGPPSWLIGTLVWGPALRLASGLRMGLMFGWRPFRPSDVDLLRGLVADGVIEPPIDSRFPLDQVATALKRVDDGANRGKVIVIPGDASA